MFEHEAEINNPLIHTLQNNCKSVEHALLYTWDKMIDPRTSFDMLKS